jgi:hypothetical protein
MTTDFIPRRGRFLRSLLLSAISALPLFAATYIVPPDEVLIDDAAIIVSGTILDSWSQPAEGGEIETIYRLAVDEVLKGESSTDVIEIREWGGILGDRWMSSSATGVYTRGERYLLFLTPARDGRLATLQQDLGRFRFTSSHDSLHLARDDSGARFLDPSGRDVPSHPRDASELLDRIRDRVAGREVSAHSASTIGVSANDLDLRQAASKGVSQWSSGTAVNYSLSNTPASGNGRGNDGEDRILIDNPNCHPSGGECIEGSFGGTGTVAIAYFGGTVGSDRITITYADIVIQNGVGTSTGFNQEMYDTILTHELGHTLGFRHSNQNRYSQSGSSCASPLPCSSSAVMNSFVVKGLQGSLQAWDKSAVQANFGAAPAGDYLTHELSSDKPWYRSHPNVVWRLGSSGSSCGGPAISAGPAAFPSVIRAGESSQLSVSAFASTGTLAYQWYRGARGNTSSPVSGGQQSSVGVAPQTTTSYWVRLTDGCGSIDSSEVKVTVTTCEPVITGQPVSRAIGPGESTILTVIASNAESFTWYAGARGNISVPVGTGSSITVSPAETTSYWARVANSCATVDSQAAIVTVLSCPPPTITVQPKDVEIERGESATLQVQGVGIGTLSYVWYRGESGDVSQKIAEGPVLVTGALESSERYWVRVGDDCGFRDSRTARVTLVQTCRVPSVEVQPENVMVPIGGRAILSFEASGSSLRYQWYRLDTVVAIEIRGATGPVLDTGALQERRIYYARVWNGCGSSQTRQVVVDLSDCALPAIDEGPRSSASGTSSAVTLTVMASGSTPLSYQWFEGEKGSVARPVAGATSATFIPQGHVGTKRFWVRVSNDCGFADSDAVTVVFDSPRRRPVGRRE